MAPKKYSSLWNKSHRTRWRFGTTLLLSLLCFGGNGGVLANAADDLHIESGLAHWWPGNGTRTDIIGGTNANLIGGSGYAPGKMGEAFAIGPAAYVKLPYSIGNFGTNDFTIALWIKTNGTGAISPILTKRSDSTHILSLTLNEAGIPVVEIRNGGDSTTVTGINPVSDNAWHRLAIVREGLSVSLFLDDALDISNSGYNGNVIHLGDDPGYASAPMTVGADLSDSELVFRGAIDEVMIYNRPLSQADLARCALPSGRPLPINICDTLIPPTNICAGLPSHTKADKTTQDACEESFESEMDKFLQSKEQCDVSLRREGNKAEDENEQSARKFRECIIHNGDRENAPPKL